MDETLLCKTATDQFGMFVFYCCLTVRPNILVSVVTLKVCTHILHMNSDVSARSGDSAHIIDLIPFSILSYSVLAVQNENPLRGILVSLLLLLRIHLNLGTFH